MLRVEFINQGQQLLTTASDGLAKLWNVRQEDCTASLDNHEDKVRILFDQTYNTYRHAIQIWALAVSRDERTVVTGAADSVITFWVDATEEEQKQKETEKAGLVAL